IESVATIFRSTHQRTVLRLVLRNNIKLAVARLFARFRNNVFDNVTGRGIEYLLSGIQTESVEMEFFDPISGICTDKFSYRFAVTAVVIENITPFAFVGGRKIIPRKLPEITTTGTAVVVHHIQNDSNSEAMGFVDKCAQVIWCSVVMVGRKKIHSVITPTEFSIKFCEGHYFNNSNAQAR